VLPSQIRRFGLRTVTLWRAYSGSSKLMVLTTKKVLSPGVIDIVAPMGKGQWAKGERRNSVITQSLMASRLSSCSPSPAQMRPVSVSFVRRRAAMYLNPASIAVLVPQSPNEVALHRHRVGQGAKG
jgi:hypothetical protein